MVEKSHRVVIRRPVVHEEEYHGGGWKIAYADFMTAMMAFFLVLWLLTLIPKDELPEIAEFFRRPLSALTQTPGGSSSLSVIPGGSPSIIPNPSGSEVQVPNVRGSDDRSNTRDDAHSETMHLEDIKVRLETLIATNPRLTEFSPQMVLDMTPEGLRVQIVDGQNKPMFAVGSASMHKDMQTILTELAGTLNALPNQVSIAGHTDASRYAMGDRAYSNWELSSDRANAARRALVAGGLAENKVQSIIGLGSTMGASADPMDHANRRISIIVLNKQSEDQMRRTYSSTQVSPAEVLSAAQQPHRPAVPWPGSLANPVDVLESFPTLSAN